MGLFGPPNVEKLKQKRDIQGLLKALTGKKGEIRAGAARALGELRAAEALPGLCAATADRDQSVVEAAIEALGVLHDPQSLPTLLDLLDRGYAEEALDALQGFDDPRLVWGIVAKLPKFFFSAGASKKALEILGRRREASIAALLEAFQKNPHTREYAAALRDLGWTPSRDEIGATYCILNCEWEACASLGEIAVEPLKAALIDKTNAASRSSIGKALASIGKPALPAVLPLLDWTDAGTREAAGEVLVELGPHAAPALVERFLAKGDDDTARLLAKIGSPAFPLLEDALPKRNFSRRKKIIAVLQKAGWQPESRVARLLYWSLQGWDHMPCPSQDWEDRFFWTIAQGRTSIGLADRKQAYQPWIETGERGFWLALFALEKYPNFDDDQQSNHDARSIFYSNVVYVLNATFPALIEEEEQGRALQALVELFAQSQFLTLPGDRGSQAYAVLKEIHHPQIAPLLLQAVAHQYVGSRPPGNYSAVRELVQELGYQPENRPEDAFYYFMCKDWGGLYRMSPIPVQMLFDILTYQEHYLRRGAAEQLVSMYQQGQLTDEDKTRLLAFRSVITRSHQDYSVHADDTGRSNDCGGSEMVHTDEDGLGLTFDI